jgi:hypothetical protein
LERILEVGRNPVQKQVITGFVHNQDKASNSHVFFVAFVSGNWLNAQRHLVVAEPAPRDRSHDGVQSGRHPQLPVALDPVPRVAAVE